MSGTSKKTDASDNSQARKKAAADQESGTLLKHGESGGADAQVGAAAASFLGVLQALSQDDVEGEADATASSAISDEAPRSSETRSDVDGGTGVPQASRDTEQDVAPPSYTPADGSETPTGPLQLEPFIVDAPQPSPDDPDDATEETSGFDQGSVQTVDGVAGGNSGARAENDDGTASDTVSVSPSETEPESPGPEPIDLTFVVPDGFPDDTITGTSGDNDVIDLSGLSGAVTVTYTASEAGTITDGTNTITFSDIERLILTDHDDVVHGALDAAGMRIDAGDGNDTVAGGSGADTLLGEAGNDSLTGADGADRLFGGAGSDTLIGGADADSLVGGDDADTFLVEDSFGNDTIIGGEGGTDDDVIDLSNVTGSMTVTYAGDEAGEVTDGADTLAFSETERLVLTDQADSVDGTNDTAGLDIDAGAGNDTIDGGTGADSVTGGLGDDSLSGGAGDDTLEGGVGNDTLEGGLNNDSLSGGANDDVLRGGAGNDTLTAGDGADRLEGGTGNDTLAGGDGSDTAVWSGDFADYHVAYDSGTDTYTITDQNVADGDEGVDTVTGVETFTFNGVDYTAADMQAAANRAPTDITFTGGTVNETVVDGGTIDSAYDPSGATVATLSTTDADTGDSHNYTLISDPSGKFEIVGNEIRVRAGQTVDYETDTSFDLTIRSTDPFGESVDEVITLNVADFEGSYTAGNGGEAVTGTSEEDAITGGTGNDTIDGGDGDDTIDAGAGDDSLTGGIGEDSLLGGGGNDTIEAGANHDTVDGGAGDDLIDGGHSQDSLSGGADNDTLLGGTGGDTLDGGTGDDSLSGQDHDDSLLGAAGDDTLTGGTGNDTLIGGDDTDTATWAGDLSDYTVIYDAGSDSFTVTDNNAGDGLDEGTDVVREVETFVFNGTSYTEAEMRAYADGSAPTAIGFASGGTVNESVVDGGTIDSAYDPSGATVGRLATTDASGADDTHSYTLVSDPSGKFEIVGDEIRVRAGQSIDYETDTSFDVTVRTTDINGQSHDEILTINVVDYEGSYTITGAAENVTGTSEEDAITGGTGNDTIAGGLGDDTLYGGDGDDVLRGGSGDDVIYTGENGDTVDGGEGSDAIFLSRISRDVDNVIQDTGTAGSDTLFLSDGTGGGYEVQWNFSYATSGIEVIDASAQIGERLESAAAAINFDFTGITLIGVDHIDGTSGNDTIIGSAASDYIEGDAGADTLVGAAGNDTILGGSGSDTLTGGVGDDSLDGGNDADSFALADGFGNDTIVGGEGGADNDVIDLSALTGPVTVTYTGDEAGTITDGTDTITFSEVERLITSNFNDSIDLWNSWSGTTVDAGDGDDLITNAHDASSVAGGVGNDTITGLTVTGGGVSTIDGGDGDDVIDGADGRDLITGGDGDDTIEAGEENSQGDDDTVYGGDGNDVITSVETDSRSNDQLFGEAGDDLLSVAGGDNTLDGGTGADTISGGVGDDLILGGDDADTFVVQDSFGNDTITGGEGGTDDDVIDLSALTGPVTVNYTGNEAGTITDGTDTITFSEIERLILTDQNDSLNGSADSVGLHAGGGSGEDTLIGGSGDDTLGGGDQGDSISGGAGNDSITIDAITSFGDDDWVDGGTGNDTIISSETDTGSEDTVFGGEGDDSISMAGGQNAIDGGEGNDTITGGQHSDTITGGLGNDSIDAGAGSDTVVYDGDLDDFTITYDSGTDTFVVRDDNAADGDEGTDTVTGAETFTFNGTDYTKAQIEAYADGSAPTAISFASGGAVNETVVDGGTIGAAYDPSGDTVGVLQTADASGAGDTHSYTLISDPSGKFEIVGDEIRVRAGQSIDYETDTSFDVTVRTTDINGSTHDEILTINVTDYEGSYTVAGAAENVTGTSEEDAITGGTGNDTIAGGLGDDTIDGGSGADDLDGGDGNDSLAGGVGADTLSGDWGADTLEGGEGDDRLLGGGDGDLLSGGADNDRLEGHAGNDTLQGGDGRDTLFGGSNNDSLTGGSGDDSLDGSFGNDTMHGGTGNDTLSNWMGGDLMDGGDDADEFRVFDAFGGTTVIGGEGGTDDDILTMTDTTGPVTVTYSGDEAGEVTDGSDTLTFSEVERLVLTDQADSVDGTKDTAGLNIDAGAGNDTVLSGSGADSLVLGGGNDLVYSSAGADTIEGGLGYDEVNYWNSNAAVDIDLTDGLAESGGHAAGDSLTGLEEIDGSNSFGDTIVADDSGMRLYGHGGNDSLTGGTGDDSLAGGSGADTLRGGAGVDTIDGADGDDVIAGGAGADDLRGDSGADRFVVEDGFGNDVVTGGEGGTDDDVIDLSALTGPVTVNYTGNEAGTITDGTDAITFSEVERLILTDHNDSVTGTADGAGLHIHAGAGEDTIIGGTGNDTVYGEGDDDRISLGDGNDFAQGDGGHDTIDGGDGQDTLRGSGGNDSVSGGLGNDELTGGDGSDTLAGGAGADNLNGGNDEDTFVIEDGFGADTIIGGEGGTDDDVIDLSALTGPVTVNYTGAEAGTITDGTDTITFSEIERLILTDGADTVDGTSAPGGINVDAGAGNDVITGGSGNDTIDGGAGTDSILGGAGDDQITTGTHADTVDGGEGSDTVILYGFADGGSNVITDSGSSGTDRIVFFDDGEPTYEIQGTFSASDGIEIIDGSGVAGEFLSSSNTINWDFTGVTLIGVDEIRGSANDDSIIGSSGDDSIDGYIGNDTIIGGAGADTIEGGTGNDSLEGGLGADSLDGGAGDDTLVLGSGDTASGGTGDDVFVLDPNNTDGPGTIVINGGSETSADTITGSGLTNLTWLSGPTNDGSGSWSGSFTYENVDGETITVNFSEIETFAGDVVPGNGVVEGTSGDDSMGVGYTDADGDVITNGDDSIVAGAGWDTIDAGEGDNTVDAGSGNNRVTTGSGADSITSGSDDDTINSGGGNDTISSGAGWDNIDAGDGDNTVDAGSGNNSVTTGSGADSITSGSDDDTINSGDGNDTISSGAGWDNINAGEGDNTVDAGSGNNSVTTGSGADSITSGTDDDTINSGDGNDTISSDAGWDSIDAGDGDNVVDAGSGNNSVTTGIGADAITTGSDDDTINSGAGNDTITSGAGWDNIDAGEGDNKVDAGTGNNSVTSGSGADSITTGGDDDTINSGGGNDTIVSGDGADQINAGDGNNSVTAADGNNNVTTGTGNDSITTGAGQDTISAGAGNDSVSSGGDRDSVSGGAGNDTLHGGALADTLDGGADADTIYGGHGWDSLMGGAGDDLIYGGAGAGDDDGDDRIFGGDGNDTVIIGDGTTWSDDYVDLGAGDDVLISTSSLDSIIGGAGNDTIDAGLGHDTVDGGTGNDRISGGTGDDRLTGGDDADSFIVEDGFGNDTITGGEGGTDDDVIDLSGLSGPVTVTYSGDEAGTITDGTDTITFTEVERLILTDQADSVDGSALGASSQLDIDARDGDDTVRGGWGDDSIVGGGGNDYLDGFDGNDTLDGGDGNDTILASYDDGTGDVIIGGNGIDTFQIDGSSSESQAYAVNLTTGVDQWNNTFSGIENVNGGDGADTITGDTVDNNLSGGDNADSFIVLDNFGNDTITGGEGGTDNDVIDLSGLTGPVTVTYTGNEAGTITDGTDTITFSEIERLILTDYADVVDATADSLGIDVEAGDGDDTITGTDEEDRIVAGAGNDVVYGKADDDTVDGGEGSDQLFLNGWDKGATNVYTDSGTTGTDTLILEDSGSMKTFRIQGDFSAADGIEVIDGSNVTGETLGTNDANANFDFTGVTLIDVDEISGTNSNDTIIGSSGADFINGRNGDDVLSGAGGNDTISGDNGADSINGGTGDDSLLGGDGSDTIEGGAGDDVISGGNSANVSPIIEMHFEDGASGTATDDSGNNHDGVYQGDAAAGSTGWDGSGTALVLDGSGDYVEIPDSTDFDLANGTAAIRFNVDALSGTQCMFSRDSAYYDGGGHFRVYVNSNGSVSARIQSSTDSYYVHSSSGAVSAGSWHHVAVSFGADGVHLYLDGVEVDTHSYTGGLGGNDEPWTIGADQWHSGDGTADNLKHYFDGQLDEFLLVGEQLDASQIADLSTNGASSLKDNDVAVYQGDIADFNIAYDSGSGVFTITDTNTGDGLDEGTDTVDGIESFQFNGTTYSAADVQALANAAPTDIAFTASEVQAVSQAVVTGEIRENTGATSIDRWSITHNGGDLAIDVFADGFNSSTLDSEIRLYRDNGDGTYTEVSSNDDGALGDDGSTSSYDSYLSVSGLAAGDYILAIGSYPMSDAEARDTASSYSNADGGGGAYQVTFTGDAAINGIAANPAGGGDWGNPGGDASIVSTVAGLDTGSEVARAFSVTDADGGDTHTFSFVGGSTNFAIDTNTGSITLNGAYDPATAISETVTVRATDNDGATYDEAIGLYIGAHEGGTRIDAGNYSATGNGYTVTAQNVSGGVLTAASVANVSTYFGGEAIGASGTSGDGDSGVTEQIAYDEASGLSENITISFDSDINELSFDFQNLYTQDFSEEATWSIYNDGALVAQGTFREDVAGSGTGTVDVVGHGDFDAIVFTANQEIDGAGSSDYGLTSVTFGPGSVGDSVTGGAGTDIMHGLGGRDTLDGGAGDDVISGGAGDDSLIGGSGNDSITGGLGDDSMQGGDGDDVFFVAAMQGADTISGGAGGSWTDALDLENMGAGAVNMSGDTVDGDGWTLVLDGSSSVTSLNAGVLELSTDAAGVVTFDDGGTISFSDLERVTW